MRNGDVCVGEPRIHSMVHVLLYREPSKSTCRLRLPKEEFLNHSTAAGISFLSNGGGIPLSIASGESTKIILARMVPKLGAQSNLTP
ncbi:hypothetical protein BN1723_014496 [Verticillium longisporum]|uniref:Uncharacterized protein n=1 Tax=Verticillium longisporum TaxID=100787 RepID=A0A0G4MAU3_VERLO|nr:hypothetical protein BN1723_014496 [Verticillium longisporum]